MFPGAGVSRLIADVARRRAYAVVHEEEKERLMEVFAVEREVLKARGVERVMKDIGKGAEVPLPGEGKGAEASGPEKGA